MHAFGFTPRRAGVAVLALACLAAAPLSAETSISVQGGPVRVVSYADLDLSTAQGMATLDQRIAAAARRVCMPAVASTASKTEYECRSATIAAAKAQLDPANFAAGR